MSSRRDSTNSRTPGRVRFQSGMQEPLFERHLALGAAIGAVAGLVILGDLALGMILGAVIGAYVGRAKAAAAKSSGGRLRD